MIFTLIYRGQRYYLNAEHLARLVMLLALNHNNRNQRKGKQ